MKLIPRKKISKDKNQVAMVPEISSPQATQCGATLAQHAPWYSLVHRGPSVGMLAFECSQGTTKNLLLTTQTAFINILASLDSWSRGDRENSWPISTYSIELASCVWLLLIADSIVIQIQSPTCKTPLIIWLEPHQWRIIIKTKSAPPVVQFGEALSKYSLYPVFCFWIVRFLKNHHSNCLPQTSCHRKCNFPEGAVGDPSWHRWFFLAIGKSL